MLNTNGGDMKTQEVISVAGNYLKDLSGHEFDILTLSKPVSPAAAVDLSKVVSKLSPLLGNMIEFNVVEYLNDQDDFVGLGRWKRQDPGFPDAIFEGSVYPTPGFEIKAWFPLATEITARFKDSQNHFKHDQTFVAMLAWLPENLLFGKPHIIDVCVVSGKSVAKARDNHYHNPPDYLVLEPEDTSGRTRNLQQTNTNGYKFQGTPAQLKKAEKLARSWGKDWDKYKPTKKYQEQLRELMAKFPYRLDTNYAKMDRIEHKGIEDFKKTILATTFHKRTISNWSALLYRTPEDQLKKTLESELGITEKDTESILL